MPGLNFKSCFAPAVKARLKRCTIRRKRVRPIKAGDTLYLWSDQRTRHPKSLGEATCTSVENFCISCSTQPMRRVLVILGDRILDREQLRQLARDDGFEGIFDMLSFFRRTHGFPFLGDLIRW